MRGELPGDRMAPGANNLFTWLIISAGGYYIQVVSNLFYGWAVLFYC